MYNVLRARFVRCLDGNNAWNRVPQSVPNRVSSRTAKQCVSNGWRSCSGSAIVSDNGAACARTRRRHTHKRFRSHRTLRVGNGMWWKHLKVYFFFYTQRTNVGGIDTRACVQWRLIIAVTSEAHTACVLYGCLTRSFAATRLRATSDGSADGVGTRMFSRESGVGPAVHRACFRALVEWRCITPLRSRRCHPARFNVWRRRALRAIENPSRSRVVLPHMCVAGSTQPTAAHVHGERASPNARVSRVTRRDPHRFGGTAWHCGPDGR